MTAPYYVLSPEETHTWRCPCGNREHFRGIDDRGYGGPECCECGAREHNEQTDDIKQWRECSCLTVLSQDFHILRDAKQPTDAPDTDGSYSVDYESFDGGGSDGEIGSYTRIYCSDCDRLLYRESE